MNEPNPKRQKTDGPHLVPVGSVDKEEDAQEVASMATTATAVGNKLEEVGRLDDTIRRHDDLTRSHNDLTRSHNDLTGVVSVLKSRLDDFTGAFGPATIYAFMETAVYSSVDDSIDDAVKSGVASACSLLLEVLASNDQTLLQDSLKKFKKWNGPGNTIFLKKDCLPVQGLHGLLAFVDKADPSEITGWSPKDRNSLSHNKGFLDSIYKSTEKATSLDHTIVKNEVKEKKAYYADEGLKVDSLDALKALDMTELEQKLKAKLGTVVAAVHGKGVSVDEACQDQVGKFLLSLGN